MTLRSSTRILLISFNSRETQFESIRSESNAKGSLILTEFVKIRYPLVGAGDGSEL